MKAFREFWARTLVYIVILGLFLLFMWSLVEGAKLWSIALERQTPTVTATVATLVPSTPTRPAVPTATVPSTPTIGLISELGESLPPHEPTPFVTTGGLECYRWMKENLP